LQGIRKRHRGNEREGDGHQQCLVHGNLPKARLRGAPTASPAFHPFYMDDRAATDDQLIKSSIRVRTNLAPSGVFVVFDLYRFPLGQIDPNSSR
jgi:hypothetical protein